MSVYEKIYQADEEKLFACYKVPSEFQGDVIVHVDKPKGKQRKNENHNLLKLYEWKNNKYNKITPGEFLKNKQYKSYNLMNKLFDNYNPDETVREQLTKTEINEQKSLMNHVAQSKAFLIALDYINKNCGKKFTKDEFKNQISKLWFSFYSWGKMKDLSGFEHTFVGEQKENNATGYHFWFKYLIDDSVDNDTGYDNISFGGLYDKGKNPNYVAVRFKLDVDDTSDDDPNTIFSLFKPISSFFVGMGPITMMLLGTVVYYDTKPKWKNSRGGKSNHSYKDNDDDGVETTIGDHKYKLMCHHGGPGKKFIRTFFPEINE
eukprot:gene9567-1770_t